MEISLEYAQKILQQRLPSYQIVRWLGSGSYGVVYLAEDSDTRQQFAVKIFRMERHSAVSKEDGTITDAVTRLNRDWKLLQEQHALLKRCPSIVEIPIFFSLRVADGLESRSKASALGIAVMEYYPENLHDHVLEPIACKGQPWSESHRLKLLRALAEAMRQLHTLTDQEGRPFVYEDLKPTNVLVRMPTKGEMPQVVIGDIGGLRQVGLSGSSGGQVTMAYAAPEKVVEMKSPDERSVVYSFGLVGFFILEGRIPHDDVEGLVERFSSLDTDPGFTPRMSAGLGAVTQVLRRCLKTDRNLRYANFDEVCRALTLWAGDTPEPMVGSKSAVPPLPDGSLKIPKSIQVPASRVPEPKAILINGGKDAISAQKPNIFSTFSSILKGAVAPRFSKNPKLGDEWRCPVTGMVFLWIPGGIFMMGNDKTYDAKPRHEVELDGFWMGKYPVTQGEWQKVMQSNPSKYKKGDLYPVESVLWDDVQRFIAELNRQVDDKYRLPTEAEWEYACRAGSQAAYCFGDDEDKLGKYAVYCSNSGAKWVGIGKGRSLTQDGLNEVGTKKPNAWGLHDMHGNVWEWCQDWYDKDYYANSPRRNPRGPDEGYSRVNRGGCWGSNPAYVRSAYRRCNTPDARYGNLGFRLARTDS
ncbi:Hercynine oxygenase [Candidatus Magnetaquicoccaceae bacterium FCR-1]|uniref:Hercynine oxygenase n=1 Tax=Candidatus Magnetaquiglobus chichijimensis TaxID=3141448 RepID=A0ABQ0CAK4_9PROT